MRDLMILLIVDHPSSEFIMWVFGLPWISCPGNSTGLIDGQYTTTHTHTHIDGHPTTHSGHISALLQQSRAESKFIHQEAAQQSVKNNDGYVQHLIVRYMFSPHLLYSPTHLLARLTLTDSSSSLYLLTHFLSFLAYFLIFRHLPPYPLLFLPLLLPYSLSPFLLSSFPTISISFFIFLSLWLIL